MMTLTPLIAEFSATGELKDIEIKSDGRVKYLLLSTDKEDYWIKVNKDQPKNLGQQLQPGDQLKVDGMLKRKLKKDKVEYKAYAIKVLTPAEVPQIKTPSAKSSKAKKPTAKVLICKKSNCWNQGGKEAYKKLTEELETRGISEKIEIKTTGCLKKCKKAPNMVVMPDKKQYIKVKPQQISAIVDQHFP